MMRNHRVDHHHRRRGATILEVIFAIGVLLFGLVGIAAVIPAAGKLARNSVDFSRGSAMGVSIASGFEAMNYNVTGRWRSINDTQAAASITTLAAGQAVCLDPLFMSRPENLVNYDPNDTSFNPGRYQPFVGPGTNNGFRRNRFPYYASSYNPLEDPAQTSSLSWVGTPTPRLIRASLTGTGAADSMITAQAAARSFDDRDQLTFSQPEDDTLPVGQVFRNASDTVFFPATRSSKPNYSWFATIRPLSLSVGTANIVVIKDRDRTFFTPAVGEVLPSELSERLALVNPAVVANFSGGGGGTIELVATTAVSNEISDGSWLMLIKNTISGPQHAWYRVVQSEADAILEPNFTDPVGTTGNHAVWRRGVTLEGPDWTFDATTVAALVDGVVSVIEFPIRIR
ncbi:type IV pilus modification PilV family protein [Planctomycetaceae bacterium SH139]